MTAVLDYLFPVLKAAWQALLVGSADFARNNLSLGWVLFLIVLGLLVRTLNFYLLQRSARKAIAAVEPGQSGGSWFRREVRYSTLIQFTVVAIALILLPITLLVLFVWAVVWGVRKARAAWKKRKDAKAGATPSEPGQPDGTDQAEGSEKPEEKKEFGVLVATVAPKIGRAHV